MLNSDVLNQLSQLKQDILASKEFAIGKVVGSSGRFGFVKLEDGRDAFLSPEKMQRVIPGDEVKVCIKTNDQNKLEAELETLISPGVGRFIGHYRIKGAAHFIQPEGQQASRWIFLPPKMRGKCQEGDVIVAKLISHPFEDGKASAKVLEKVGREDEKQFELKYVRAKHDLTLHESPAVISEAKEISTVFSANNFGERPDLTDLAFVTIDSETTKDMDDAIAIEKLADGRTRLHVAIADPSSFIKQNSALARHAFERSQTVYLTGGSIPMLPIQLSHYCFSLEANKKRPALVCHVDLDAAGHIVDYRFEFALVESRYKLSYDSVAEFLETATTRLEENGVTPEIRSMLQDLREFSTLRRQYREQNYLLSQDQADYDFELDEQGHIAAIHKRSRNVAHQIVEEAMLAANLCSANLLAQHGVGIAVTHKGFRDERLGEALALLKEEAVEHGDVTGLQEHIALFRKLEADTKTAGLIAPLRRMMDATVLSKQFNPHLGMGTPAYATITSPIRRYADLYNHWAIKRILGAGELIAINDQQLDNLQEFLQAGRQADRELTQWLVCLYAKSLLGKLAEGKIRIVTQHGFGVKLEENGIEGFVLFPKDKEKKYDAKRMTIEVDAVLYHIGKELQIKIKSVDESKHRVGFELA